ncbi:hypothetical protein GA0074692_2002 [Micromonospora pallida]|uniref:PASTA domain-containing protein n=1 Tax=Micromonospora pallida TaxID=145854 RepID=A0A1C6S862_9ACTN|nr:hypothetical protein [Micromonospora pallida]SCL25652.1 hypothetical protein GA0074692_2002 [Micromonospora pallida]
MAIRQVTVPWVRGYDFGVGADLASGSPMGMVVAGGATPVDNAQGATVNIQIQRIQSTEELEQALGIDVEASYGCAAFGAGVSGRFSFARKAKVQASSLFLSISVQVELAFLSIDDPVLTAPAAESINLPDNFAARYGNMFVRGIGRGGLFVGVLRIDTNSSAESTDITAKLGGSYALFSGEAETKFREVQQQYRNEVFVQMYHEGGPTDLRIADPGDPLQLLTNANLFLQSFQTNPDQVARPYFVTLAPVVIARGPLPLNAAEIEHAQDVLIYCAKRRSALLDQMNLLDYINDNPSQYADGDTASRDAVRRAIQDLQTDLDLIAACASAAINNPAKAKMPAEFAADRGTTFPKASLPDPLPAAKAGQNMVAVPDFRGCATQAACRELAERSGLRLAYEYQGKEFADFRVLDFRPPKGTMQPAGSIITISCPPSRRSMQMNITRVWGTRIADFGR